MMFDLVMESLPTILATISTIAVAAITAYSKSSFKEMSARIDALTAENTRQRHTIIEIKTDHKRAMDELKEENKQLRARVAELYERLANGHSRGIF